MLDIFDPQADDQELLAQVIDFYHRTLKETTEGLHYLRKRGITAGEAIDHFRIGYANRTLGLKLPPMAAKGGKEIRTRLRQLGVYRNNGREHLNGCVVFPITAVDGRIADIYGRKTRTDLHKGIPLHLHLSEQRRGVWNVECFADADDIIICPSLFDGLTFWNAGYRNVTCTFGPDSLTDDHLMAFSDFGIRRAFVMAESIAPRLLSAGIECHLLPFPPGVDANRYARKTREPAQRLGEIIATAVGLGTPAAPTGDRATVKASSKSVRTAAVRRCEDGDQKLLAHVVDFYHRTLKETTEGLDYLRKRGITVAEAIDRFRIGYSNRTLGPTLPIKQIKAGREIRTRLQQLGILQGRGSEHFCGSVVFPIMATDGRIVDLYGRKTTDHLRKGTPLHVYLSDKRRGVWNVESFRGSDEIILCASLFDALTFWNTGYRNVTCTFGPDALTDDHLAAFTEFGIRRVLAASEAIVPRLLAAGIDCYQLALPMGIDVDEYVRQMGDAAQALGESIRKSAWQGKGAGPTVRVADVPPSIPVESDTTESHDDEGGDELDDLIDSELDGAALDQMDDDDEPSDADESLPPPILTASPLAPAPKDVEADVTGDEVTMQLGLRRYRVRGLSKNLAFEQMKVNVLVTTDKGMYVDTFDLYLARYRRQFTAQAALELGLEEKTIKKDLGRVLLKLEELQDQQIAKAIKPQELLPTMTPEEREGALALLRDPQLLDRIVNDFDNVVGETTNKLVGYLAAVSRKLDQPLAIIVQSSSAAGKTSLMDGILSFVPPEDRVQYSAMTGQSLFYMGETNLKHKILAIVEEEGAERAAYALKLLQSEGALTIASTGKDGSTGRMVTQTYRVEGPVMIFLTTTAIKIDEELLNRCIVLSVNEDREQTKAIHQFQRRRQTLAGLLADQDRQTILALHRNAQRLLRPLLVANPYAESLTFQDDKTRTRRDHAKYLTLIRAVALLHQYQRPIKTAEHNGEVVEYIEVTLDDIAVANRLACEALGRSVDELPPQTRRLLMLIDEMVNEVSGRLGIDRDDHRFGRRDIRQFTGWGHTQLKVHLKRLEDMEYLLIHRGGRGQSFLYELLYDQLPDAQSKFLAKLIDVDQLKCKHDANWSGSEGEKSGNSRGQVGVKSGQSRPLEIDANADAISTIPASTEKVSQNANLDAEKSVAS